MFLHFYINPSARGKGWGGGEGESACARVLFWYFFNNLHFTHALAWKAEWEWRQRSLNKWSVCAYLRTYIHTYCTNMSVWQCDRSIEIWIGMNCTGQGSGEGGEVWSMDWLWKWKRMHVTSACECIINIIYRTRHLPKIPLRHHIRLLFECVRVCPYVRVCVCVKIYGVLENCVRRTLKVCQKICRKTRQKQIYMRRRSLCINVLFDKSFKELLADQRAASTT